MKRKKIQSKTAVVSQGKETCVEAQKAKFFSSPRPQQSQCEEYFFSSFFLRREKGGERPFLLIQLKKSNNVSLFYYFSVWLIIGFFCRQKIVIRRANNASLISPHFSATFSAIFFSSVHFAHIKRNVEIFSSFLPLFLSLFFIRRSQEEQEEESK